MSSRDEFRAAVVRNLELAAGTRCSAPFCRKETTAASGAGDVVRIGVAAHITGASPGGARYDLSLSKAERSSASNGIWMCQDHARLIDVDDTRYPPELLREWKRIAENRTLSAADPKPVELVAYRRQVALGVDSIATDVGEWAHDIGLAETWGHRIAEGVQALVAEVLLNEVQHVDPPTASARLSSKHREVAVEFSSSAFGPQELLDSPNPGGGRSVLDLVLTRLHPALKVSHTHRAGRNIWYFGLERWPDDGCGWDARSMPSGLDLARLRGCAVVRLRLGGVTLMMSAPTRLIAALAGEGITEVAVVDVDDHHFLADALTSEAGRQGVTLRFLGVPGSAD